MGDVVAQALLDLGLDVALHGALMRVPALGGEAHIVHDAHLDVAPAAALDVGGDALGQALLGASDAAELLRCGRRRLTLEVALDEHLDAALLAVDEQNEERDGQEDGRHPDHVGPQRGDRPVSDDGAKDEARDHKEAQQPPAQLLLVAIARIGDQGLGPAAQVADAHGGGKRAAVELAKRLDLDAAGKGREAVGVKAAPLGNKAHDHEQNRLDDEGHLAPVQVFLRGNDLYGVAQGDAGGEADHRDGVVQALDPVARSQVDAEQQHVAGLRVCKDVIAHEVGVGVHDAARKREEDRKLDGLGLLLRAGHVLNLSDAFCLA